ncbi:metallophosphoesterase family protein [Aliarcobacter butzleri]|uniref:metallophosphoesterase family protein n=1 Tax=Aliarcobacter butzleri TaxID=28197 RepID=UPI003AF92C79
MEKKIRWIHLSDFHTGKDNYETIKIFKHILSGITRQIRDISEPDFVFITGDIANKGNENEYITFNDEFLEPLCKILKIESPLNKIFIVPGNHDLERKFVKDLNYDNHLNGSNSFFNCDIKGKEEREIHHVRAFKNFSEYIYMANFNKTSWLDSNDGFFTEKIKKNDILVGIVGINTAWLSKDESDEKKLTPGLDLVEKALSSIDDCDLKLVLGHHPLLWFNETHKETIERMFSDNNVLYIHGHLHKNRVQPLSNGLNDFLEIQSGASFQIKEHTESLWKNGYVWAEVDLKENYIYLQPRYWKHTERRWGVSDDLHEDAKYLTEVHRDNWWRFSIPTKKEKNLPDKIIDDEPKIELSQGWEIIDESYFSKRESKDTDQLLLSFFDGAVPILNREFLTKLPQRDGLSIIVDNINQQSASNKVSISLITGAGGEGKTTCLYQSILYFFGQEDWIILWNQNNNKIQLETLNSLPKNKKILFASDDADLLVKNLKDVLDWLSKSKKEFNIHFLLSCRETDWNESEGNKVDWKLLCNYKSVILGKLNLEESRKIVSLWSNYQKRGLKDMYGLTIEEAALKLQKATEDVRGKGDGAFLGGMLKVRFSNGLKDHVRNILLNLKDKKIDSSSYTLLDAYSIIAFMHIEGLNNLSYPILSQYIFNNPEKNIRGKIITPLGREAAATPSGDFIYTRHSSIARETRILLVEEFNINPEEIYVTLASVAIYAREKVNIPKYSFWNYEYPEYFLRNEQTYLAIKIAEKEHQMLPNDKFIFSNLTKLYRKTEDDDLAIKLYHSVEDCKIFDRILYYEWSIVELKQNNTLLSAILLATSLSDFLSEPVKNDTARLGFTSIVGIFSSLYNDYSNKKFKITVDSATKIVLLFPENNNDDGSNIISFIDKGLNYKQLLSNIIEGFSSLYDYISIDSHLMEKLPVKSEMSFDKLHTLIENKLG